MNISGLVSSFLSILQTISFSDVMDVLIVTVLVYNVLNLFKQTRAFQLLKGIAVVLFVYIFATQFRLKTLSFLITSLMQVGFIALLVVFQPELRRALEQVGNKSLFSLSMLKKKPPEQQEAERLQKAIAAICDGTERMSEKQTGALMVMEKFTSLDDIQRTGTVINSDISPELIGTIFYDGSPLHDGAVIIHDGKISSAGCVLPLSDNLEISKDMGTRHRAALGLSEVSDALILVVSEETGIISVAKNGVLVRNLDRQTLYHMLTKEFVQPILDAGDKTGPSAFFRRKKDEQ